ncbi:type II secretion system minor pseudopilin GspK [Trichloromonas sp.]|uniref:type II secretion system minor pseudopilin GspK n=1 Tax=Trichloromonas sp. TaxID=3069249 RepID=UPI002A4A5383|nr:type II secretion system minor pseudopilin GspK [Trichloromonas sp.]
MRILRQQSGMVLLLVLVVVTLLSALVIELAFSTLVDLRLTETFRDTSRAYYLAKGGVRAGRGILRMDSNGYDAPNDPAELWSLGVAQYPVAEGYLSVTIEDLGGRINLNALVSAGNVNPVIKSRLMRLFDELALSTGEELIAALIDWLDPDDRVYVDPEGRRAMGAETGAYLGGEKPVRCKNGPLDNLEELLLVRGFTPEIFKEIAPFVRLHGNDKINVNSAPAEVLMALSEDPEITRDAAEAIIERRSETPFKSPAELGWINELPGLANLLREPFTVTSDIYRIEATATVNDGVRRAEAVVNKTGDQLLYLKVD